MAKRNLRRLRSSAARLSENFLSLIIALVVFLCLSVGAGFVFGYYQLEFSQQLTTVLFLIVLPILAVSAAVWLILLNIRRINAPVKDDSINCRIIPLADQRRKLNANVSELARVLEISDDRLSDLRSAYIVAEDLAFREIENETKISLRRHVALDTIDFDAVLIDEKTVKCIEVVFLVTPEIEQKRVDAILRKMETAKNVFARTQPHCKLILMLALVTQFDRKDEIKLRSTLTDKFATTSVDIDIRLYDFETLQESYSDKG